MHTFPFRIEKYNVSYLETKNLMCLVSVLIQGINIAASYLLFATQILVIAMENTTSKHYLEQQK